MYTVLKTFRVYIPLLVAVILLSAVSGVTSSERDNSDRSSALPFPQSSALPFVPVFSPFDSELSNGKFLVADRQIGDPMFGKTVILLIKYDRSGAVGVIINRPTEVKLSSMFPEIRKLQGKADVICIGGPVERDRMMVLVQSKERPEEALQVFGNVYAGSSASLFMRLIDDPLPDERFRLYAGYAGWSPGQLEREIARGDWHILRADAATVFDKDSSAIWPELIDRGTALEVKMQKPATERNDTLRL